MRILVTGAKGMLGGDLCRALAAEGHEVCATGSAEMDVRLPERVRETVGDFKPEIVYHLAALTDVDACERDPEASYRTNTIGAQNVALACQAGDVPMIYLSTIAVFDGTKADAYTEFDQPNPQSAYSRAKYEGEKIVQSLLRRYFIVRAGWMFGGGRDDKKFVGKMLALARTRPELQAVDDKFGSPTYTVDLAQGLMRLAETGLYGVYHLVNTGAPSSRYEFAQKILEFAGLTDCRLTPVNSEAFPMPAPRPRMEAGRNLHAELLGLNLMRPWAEALREYIVSLEQDGLGR